MELSPRRLLGNSLDDATGGSAFDLRAVDAGHGRQRGDVENVPHTVLGILRGALCVGGGSDLPRQIGALKMHRNTQNVQKKICGPNKLFTDAVGNQGFNTGNANGVLSMYFGINTYTYILGLEIVWCKTLKGKGQNDQIRSVHWWIFRS